MITKTITGLEINNDCLEPLRRALQKWRYLNADESWLSDKDAPWWYNERASLSVFAGAIWTTGGTAFEEFLTTRRHKRARGGREERNGRCDIYFCLEGREYIAEAKQCWPTLTGSDSNPFQTTEKSVRKTLEEVRALHYPEGFHRLGITFAAPRIHKNKADSSRDLILAYINSVRMRAKAAVAWTFPAKARGMHEWGRYSYTFPGIAVIIVPLKSWA